MKKVDCKIVAQFNGVHYPPKGIVEMNFIVDGSQWFEYSHKLALMGGYNIQIGAKVNGINDDKPFKLGMWDAKHMNTDLSDKEAKIKFESTPDCVYMENIDAIIVKHRENKVNGEGTLITLRCIAEIDIDEEEDEDDWGYTNGR